MREIRYFVSYNYSTKNYLFGLFPCGRKYGQGHSTLTFNHRIFSINEMVRALIREYKSQGAKNPSFVILYYKKLGVNPKRRKAFHKRIRR